MKIFILYFFKANWSWRRSFMYNKILRVVSSNILSGGKHIILLSLTSRIRINFRDFRISFMSRPKRGCVLWRTGNGGKTLWSTSWRRYVINFTGCNIFWKCYKISWLKQRSHVLVFYVLLLGSLFDWIPNAHDNLVKNSKKSCQLRVARLAACSGYI